MNVLLFRNKRLDFPETCIYLFSSCIFSQFLFTTWIFWFFLNCIYIPWNTSFLVYGSFRGVEKLNQIWCKHLSAYFQMMFWTLYYFSVTFSQSDSTLVCSIPASFFLKCPPISNLLFVDVYLNNSPLRFKSLLTNLKTFFACPDDFGFWLPFSFPWNQKLACFNASGAHYSHASNSFSRSFF